MINNQTPVIIREWKGLHPNYPSCKFWLQTCRSVRNYVQVGICKYVIESGELGAGDPKWFSSVIAAKKFAIQHGYKVLVPSDLVSELKLYVLREYNGQGLYYCVNEQGKYYYGNGVFGDANIPLLFSSRVEAIQFTARDGYITGIHHGTETLQRSVVPGDVVFNQYGRVVGVVWKVVNKWRAKDQDRRDHALNQWFADNQKVYQYATMTNQHK